MGTLTRTIRVLPQAAVPTISNVPVVKANAKRLNVDQDRDPLGDMVTVGALETFDAPTRGSNVNNYCCCGD